MRESQRSRCVDPVRGYEFACTNEVVRVVGVADRSVQPTRSRAAVSYGALAPPVELRGCGAGSVWRCPPPIHVRAPAQGFGALGRQLARVRASRRPEVGRLPGHPPTARQQMPITLECPSVRPNCLPCLEPTVQQGIKPRCRGKYIQPRTQIRYLPSTALLYIYVP